MRKLTVMGHISLDGVIQSSDEDGFPYADWTAPYRTPAGRDEVFAAHGGAFDLLLGRRTYDMWAGFWPTAPSSPMGDAIRAATKYIATRHPETLEWGPVEWLGTDFVASVRRLKLETGPPLILWGSSTLTSRLFADQLVDELFLIVYPVLLGTGKRIFASGTAAQSFELISSKAMASGVLLSHYRNVGPVNVSKA